MNATPPEREDTKEALIAAAVHLFSTKGFDATTTRNICDAAGVNNSLVNYHFESKEGLFRTCLKRYGEARLAATRRVLSAPRSKEELKIRLEMFISDFFDSYFEEPDLTNMVQREVELHPKLCEDVFRASIIKVYETLVEFFRAGQKAGLMAKDFDPAIISRLMFSQLLHIVRTEGISAAILGQSLTDKKYRAKLTDHIIRLTLDGMAAPKE